MSIAKKIWTIVKLIYLHLAYLLVGLDQEHLYIARANCFTELHWFSFAIGNYKKALNESTSPLIKAALGYCYIMIGDYEKSVLYYREAYTKMQNPDILLGLICAELNKGDIEEGKKLLALLEKNKSELESCHLDEINRIKKEMEVPN